jgi:hypothetical protein
MTVVGHQTVAAGAAHGFFGSLTGLGYTCMAQDNTRWRLRRVQVECLRGAESLLYDGGFPADYRSVVSERVHRNGRMLGGADLMAHVKKVVAELEGEPDNLATNLSASPKAAP